MKKVRETLEIISKEMFNFDFKPVVRLFEDGWKHDHKARPTIKRIFAVTLPDHLNHSYEEYK